MNDIHDHETIKLAMDEVAFKTAYIANFLATYMAINYDMDCMNGHPTKRYENQPVEDASFNANCAWNTIQERL